MNNIVLIATWFGEVPKYFTYFIKGLEFNSDIVDMILITDNKKITNYPSNLKIIHMSLGDFSCLAREKISPKVVDLKNPYKLCDFKPMYGKICEDLIKDYKFWGYSDIDIIYGDLKKFLTEENLTKYDIITFREYLISGALTILRNNNYTINLYQKSPDIEKIISSNTYFGFDEVGKKHEWCRKRVLPYKLLNIDNLFCWSSIVFLEFYSGRLNLYSKYELIESLPFQTIITFNKGAINRGLDEYVGYHLVYDKTTPFFHIPKWRLIPDVFYIHYTGIYRKINPGFFLIKNLRWIKGKIKIIFMRLRNSIKYRTRHLVKNPH